MGGKIGMKVRIGFMISGVGSSENDDIISLQNNYQRRNGKYH